jgi:Orsellinic acid/F9775 biosynthesis cluster protein D
MERYLRYDLEYQIVICVACESGLPSKWVLRHMREDHKETWMAHRKELKIFVEGLTLIPPDQLESPIGVCEAVEGIAVKDGWICGWEECTVAGVSRDWVVKHCVNAHGKEAANGKKAYKGRIQSLLWHPYIKSYWR